MAPSISAEALRSVLRDGQSIQVIDVRRQSDFFGASEMIRGALRRNPDSVAAWTGSLPPSPQILVYCVHGRAVSQSTAAALQTAGLNAAYLEGGIEAWKTIDGPLLQKPSNNATRWITRERPKIDRIACPWLIARFIDAGAEFVYVPTAEVFSAGVERSAVAYDIPSAPLTHEGDHCSFDAFLKQYCLTDPALQQLAAIVRGADTSRLDLTPQSPGLYALSLGLSHNFPDDHEMLKHGMVMYDALYAWCRSCQGETHNWPPKLA